MVDAFKEIVFSRHKSAYAHMNVQTVTACTKPVQTQARQKSQHSGRIVPMKSYPRVTKQFAIDSFLERAKLVSFNEVTVVYQLHCREGIPICFLMYELVFSSTTQNPHINSEDRSADENLSFRITLKLR